MDQTRTTLCPAFLPAEGARKSIGAEPRSPPFPSGLCRPTTPARSTAAFILGEATAFRRSTRRKKSVEQPAGGFPSCRKPGLPDLFLFPCFLCCVFFLVTLSLNTFFLCCFLERKRCVFGLRSMLAPGYWVLLRSRNMAKNVTQWPISPQFRTTSASAENTLDLQCKMLTKGRRVFVTKPILQNLSELPDLSTIKRSKRFSS